MAHQQKGLQFGRRFTKEGVSPFDQFEYDYRTSIIRNPSRCHGSVASPISPIVTNAANCARISIGFRP